MSSPKKAPSASPESEKLIKSRQRVRDLAEVYTAEKEVKAMLDLIPAKVGAKAYADATFLEPACGNGNFLIEILRRKLQSVGAIREYFETDGSRPVPLPGKGKTEAIVFTALQVAASVYGFDICANNVAETRARLWSYVVYGVDMLPPFITGNDFETLAYIEAVTPGHVLPLAPNYEENLERYASAIAAKEGLSDRLSAISPLLQRALRKVLAQNIQQGDFLAQTDAAGSPLTVGEWRFVAGKVVRSDYLVSELHLDKPPVVGRLPACSLAVFVSEAANA